MVKGETIMPVPEGEITTSEILVPETADDFDIELELDEAVENDLSELS
jgi:hypothetical protein